MIKEILKMEIEKRETIKRKIRAYLYTWLSVFESIVCENDDRLEDWYNIHFTTKTTFNTCKVLVDLMAGVINVEGKPNWQVLACLYGIDNLLGTAGSYYTALKEVNIFTQQLLDNPKNDIEMVAEKTKTLEK